jgi:hypothetical protein
MMVVYVLPPVLRVSPRLELSDERWERTRRIVERVVEASIPDLEELASRRPDPVVHAIAGRSVAFASAVERSVVTRFGRHAKEIVTPWFEECRSIGGFWDYKCVRDNGREVRTFTVKVVSGPKAFNSTMRRRVEEESKALPTPIVLTLTGTFEATHVTLVGSAYWLDAPATWLFLTWNPRGYKKFLDMLYQAGARYRRAIYTAIIKMGKTRGH